MEPYRMFPDPTLSILAGAVFILLILYIIIRNLRMPASFYEKQRAREELRRTYLKKKIIPPDDFPEEEAT